MRDYEKLDQLSRRVLWHVRRGMGGEAITRGELSKRCRDVGAEPVQMALDGLAGDGWIDWRETRGRRGQPTVRYWLASSVDASVIKPVRPGRHREATGEGYNTSVMLSMELRRKLEDAANANFVTLTREVVRRLASTFEGERA